MKRNIVINDETEYVLETGLSQAMINSFLKGGGGVVKKHCQKCGFILGKYTGAYPKNCPVCGDPFDKENISGESKYLLNSNGKCIGILHEYIENPIKESKMSEMDMDIQDVIEMFVDKKKSGEIKSKADFMKLFNDVKKGKNLPEGVDAKSVKNNIALIAKGISDAFRKEGLKF